MGGGGRELLPLRATSHVLHHYSIISFYYSCIGKIHTAENKVFMITAKAVT